MHPVQVHPAAATAARVPWSERRRRRRRRHVHARKGGTRQRGLPRGGRWRRWRRWLDACIERRCRRQWWAGNAGAGGGAQAPGGDAGPQWRPRQQCVDRGASYAERAGPTESSAAVAQVLPQAAPVVLSIRALWAARAIRARQEPAPLRARLKPARPRVVRIAAQASSCPAVTRAVTAVVHICGAKAVVAVWLLGGAAQAVVKHVGWYEGRWRGGGGGSALVGLAPARGGIGCDGGGGAALGDLDHCLHRLITPPVVHSHSHKPLAQISVACAGQWKAGAKWCWMVLLASATAGTGTEAAGGTGHGIWVRAGCELVAL